MRSIDADFRSFRSYREGRYWTNNGPHSPNPNGAQCVNVANLWRARRQLPKVVGDAGAFAGYEDHLSRWIPNRPNNYPVIGDVIVWSFSSFTPYGHVAVVGAADVRDVEWLGQNWPLGAPTLYVKSPYMGVAGWIRERGP